MKKVTIVILVWRIPHATLRAENGKLNCNRRLEQDYEGIHCMISIVQQLIFLSKFCGSLAWLFSWSLLASFLGLNPCGSWARGWRWGGLREGLLAMAHWSYIMQASHRTTLSFLNSTVVSRQSSQREHPQSVRRELENLLNRSYKTCVNSVTFYWSKPVIKPAPIQVAKPRYNKLVGWDIWRQAISAKPFTILHLTKSMS